MAEGATPNDGITSPRAAKLAKGTAAASSSMKSVIPVDPKAEENVNSLGGPAALVPSPTKAVQDTPGSAEHMLAVGGPPSSSTKSRGKAIEEPAYNQEHDGAASSTKIIPKANADAGPSVRAPAHHHDGVIAVIGGPAQPNASDAASNAAPAIPAFAQHDVNVAIAAIGGAAAGAGPAAGHPNVARQVPAPARINGGGIAVIAARPGLAQPNAGGPAAGDGPAVGQPNVARQVPAPARINGRGIAVIAARPGLAQPNARGPALNAAPLVPVLPPNPGVNYIDEALTISIIEPLRNPADGEEEKIWDKLN